MLHRTLFTPKFAEDFVLKYCCEYPAVPGALENDSKCKFRGQKECIVGDSDKKNRIILTNVRLNALFVFIIRVVFD